MKNWEREGGKDKIEGQEKGKQNKEEENNEEKEGNNIYVGKWKGEGKEIKSGQGKEGRLGDGSKFVQNLTFNSAESVDI